MYFKFKLRHVKCMNFNFHFMRLRDMSYLTPTFNLQPMWNDNLNIV